jgi:hypothetical protein
MLYSRKNRQPMLLKMDFLPQENGIAPNFTGIVKLGAIASTAYFVSEIYLPLYPNHLNAKKLDVTGLKELLQCVAIDVCAEMPDPKLTDG